MKTIKLTQGKVAIVDDEDFVELSKYKWSASGSKINGIYYAVRTISKKIIYENEIYHCKKVIRMHRFLMGLSEEDKLKQVDHINNNGLDNRKANLRICTSAENLRNRRSSGTKTSIYKGVNQKGTSGQYKANIHANGKLMHIGTYGTEIEAAMAYNIEAKKIFGEFANLNKIDNEVVPKKVKFPKTPGRSSKYKGVCLVKKTNRWQAAGRINGKITYVGVYPCELSAAYHYNKTANQIIN